MHVLGQISTGLLLGLAIITFTRVEENSNTHPRASSRNNTVLFLAGSASGLANVHVAASYGLLEHATHIEVHYGSFAGRRDTVSRVSSIATQNFPDARPIIWHELPGPDYLDAVYQRIGNISGMIFAPGLEGINRLAEGMSFHLDPWQKHDYIRLYKHIRDLIVQIDPSVIVLDSTLRPALDAARDLNRSFVILTPNALVDSVAPTQTWGRTYWMYPATGSALPYPIPWKLVPTNIYLQFRFTLAYRFNSVADEIRAYYRTKGIQNQEHLFNLKNVLVITMTTPETRLPFAVPQHVTECGPVVLDAEKVEAADLDLYNWMRQAPTVLVNLGSLMKYDEARAHIMAQAISLVLQSRDVQILWKFSKLEPYSDNFLEPLQPFLDNDRLRVSNWLSVEPISLLQSGQIVLSVHHGGANSYHEAIYAGIPQVVLPLWYDLYNYAQLVEYLGVGVWPGKDIAPAWKASIMGDGITSALDDSDLRDKAKSISEGAKKYTGRAAAAEVIARMAMQAISS